MQKHIILFTIIVYYNKLLWPCFVAILTPDNSQFVITYSDSKKAPFYIWIYNKLLITKWQTAKSKF